MSPEFVVTLPPEGGESVILDPAEIAAEGRVELPLEGNGLKIHEEGIDWGDQAVKAFMAEGTTGEPMVDYIIPNRTIKIPLIASAGDTATFDEVRESLQAKVALINEQGGWIKRTMVSGTYFFADLVEAKLHLGDDWMVANKEVDRLATLELQAFPDFYGDPIEGEVHEGTGDLAWTEKPEGALPGRVESLVVTDESGNDQRGLLWHFRARNYDSASTAKWAYNAEELEPLDLAEKVTLAGSAGTKVVKHENLSSSWTPVLGLTLSAGTHLTHEGLCDVWARVYSEGEDLPWLRLLWGVGDTIAPAENTQVQIPNTKNYYLVNLGQVNLQRTPIGSHRWKGIIQGRFAKANTIGKNVSIDRVYFLCADEASGQLRASTRPAIGAATFLARDEFSQAEGALTGKSADVGGTYTVVAESDTDDFQVIASSGTIKRGPASEDAGNSGRLVTVGTTNYGALMAKVDIKVNAFSGVTHVKGLLLRCTDKDNRLAAYLQFISDDTINAVIHKRVASVNTLLFSKTLSDWTLNEWLSLWVQVDTTGRATLWCGAQGNSEPQLLGCVEDTDLKTEGTLQTGKFGLFDSVVVGTGTSEYDNLQMWTPDTDAVMFSNRLAQIGTSGIYRQSSDGAGYGPVSYPGADLPRLPVSGSEERPVEIALKGSRGNFDTAPDSGRDLLAGQLTYRPCWAYTPGS